MRFPEGFIWGAASSSYQIEGAVNEDGKGPSIWDLYCQKQGAVKNGESGAVACDHYHRYAEDIALMQQIGLQAYRFSIAWPRILPDGVGRVNVAGLDFYDRLVDRLLEANIAPYATLYHWDMPLALYQRGGWLNRDMAHWFAEYAEVVARHLGDRVAAWMPLNEPSAVVAAGHYYGVHAPGLRMSFAENLRMIFHAHLAHGRAVQVLRDVIPADCQIGTALDGKWAVPFTESLADIEAARRVTFELTSSELQHNALWMDPLFLGQYPASAWEVFGAAMPEIKSDDLAIIHQPLDFLGVNFYSTDYVREGADGQPEVVTPPVGNLLNMSGSPITPDMMYWMPKMLFERYNLPLMITENGMSNLDWPSADHQVHDPQRIEYMRRYLTRLADAINDGVDVRGYFHWSLLDNFEWQHGYSHRLGLIYVDFQTQQRILKDSAYWYRDVIASQGATITSTPEAVAE